MKHQILILLGSVLLGTAVSCSKTGSPADIPAQKIRIVVDVEGSGAPGTRVTGVTSNSTSSEAKVNSLQIFVFNGEQLDGYGSSSGSLTATASCTAGTRDIWAVVNAPALTSVSSRIQERDATEGRQRQDHRRPPRCPCSPEGHQECPDELLPGVLLQGPFSIPDQRRR